MAADGFIRRRSFIGQMFEPSCDEPVVTSRGLMGTVTIAATYGCGGSIIGPAVAKKLALPFVDRAIPPALAAKIHELRVLREEKDLLTSIQEAADGEHGVVFADVRIKEDGVATGIDDGCAPRAAVR